MLSILFAQSVMRRADDSHESNNRHHNTVVYRGRYLHPPREQVFLLLPGILSQLALPPASYQQLIC